MTTGVFSPAEQQQLARAPRLIRHLLTIADKGGMLLTKRAETKALGEYLSKYKSQSPIVQAIIAAQPEKEEKIEATSEEALKELAQVGALLEERTDPALGDAVRDFLMGAGKAVAEASREQGLVAGGGASPAEEKALAAIAAALKATDYDKNIRIAAAAAKAQKKAEEEAKAKAEAEAAAAVKVAEEMKAKAEAEAKAKAEAAAKALAEARQRAEAEARAKAEQAQAHARQIAEQMARQREEATKKAEEQAAQAAAQQQADVMQPAAQAATLQQQADVMQPAALQQQAAAPAAQAPQAAPTIYVVKRGDTLSAIAKALLGDAGRWPEIVELNRNLIKNPNMIKTGWKLRIPAK